MLLNTRRLLLVCCEYGSNNNKSNSSNSEPNSFFLVSIHGGERQRPYVVLSESLSTSDKSCKYRYDNQNYKINNTSRNILHQFVGRFCPSVHPLPRGKQKILADHQRFATACAIENLWPVAVLVGIDRVTLIVASL